MKNIFIYALFLSVLVSMNMAHAACSTPTGQEGDMIFNESARVLQWCDGTTWYAAGQIDPAGPNDGCLDPVGVGGDIVYSSTEHLLQYCDGDHWQGIGGGVDIIPDGFTFADLTNQTQSSTVSSNIVTINGIDSPADVTISGEGTPQFRINGGSWVTSGTITNGQTLQLRLTTAAALSTTNTAIVVVGTVDAEWSASTVGSDTTPNSFTFTDQTAVPVNSMRMSNTITITGINSSTPVSVTGSGAQISINGGAWVTSGSISSGQTLQVRLTSSSSYNAAINATVTVGGVSDVWSVTTDYAPAVVTYTSFSNAPDVPGGSNQTIGTGKSLGTPAADRIIIVGLFVSDQDNSTLNSVSVAGVTATQRYITNNGGAVIAFYTAPVPTGTTGNVVVNITNSGTMGLVTATLWSVTGLLSTTPTGSANSNADPATGTLNIASGGFALGLTNTGSVGSTQTCTWTGLTETHDVPYAGGGGAISGASINGPATNLAIQAQWTATSTTRRKAAFVAWR